MNKEMHTSYVEYKKDDVEYKKNE